MIAWSVNRRLSVDGIRNEYAPLHDLFKERFSRSGKAIGPHYSYSVKEESLALLKETVSNDARQFSEKAQKLLRH